MAATAAAAVVMATMEEKEEMEEEEEKGQRYVPRYTTCRQSRGVEMKENEEEEEEKVILVERTPPPPRSQWRTLTRHQTQTSPPMPLLLRLSWLRPSSTSTWVMGCRAPFTGS